MAILRLFLSVLILLGTHVFANAAEIDKRTAGQLTQVTANFGSNPSGTLMFIYVPVKLATKPAIIVAIHYCTGTAQEYYQGSPYAQLAEQYGFIVIFPQSPYSGTCWDVSSPAALTHNGGGDSNSIANMVTYTISTYGADASRVYVTGSSSGAMMTNVMAATYPEMFQAGIVYSGVPAGCFVSSSGQVDAWNETCSQGQVDDTPQQWANVVDAMYPGYTGSRPKMQIYHGTADTTLLPPNYNETIKEWVGVFGYNMNSYTTQNNYPLTNYYTYTYGPDVQGIYAIGVGHTVPIIGAQDMDWFGFTGSSSTTTTTTSSKTAAPTSSSTFSSTTTIVTTSSTLTTSTKTTTTATGTGPAAPEYSQCGGIGWTGATTCQSPYTCKVSNPYYSQCL